MTSHGVTPNLSSDLPFQIIDAAEVLAQKIVTVAKNIQ